MEKSGYGGVLGTAWPGVAGGFGLCMSHSCVTTCGFVFALPMQIRS